MKKFYKPALAVAVLLMLITLAVPAFCQSSSNQNQQTLVNLDLKDTSVRTAIEALFKGTGLNVVISSSVPNATIPNLSLKDVNFEQALRTLTKAAGLTYRQEGGVYMIDVKKTEPVQNTAAPTATPDMMAPEVADRKVEKIAINFADAADIAALFGGQSITSRTSSLAFNGANGGNGGGSYGSSGGFGNSSGGFGSNSGFGSSGSGSFGSGFGSSSFGSGWR